MSRRRDFPRYTPPVRALDVKNKSHSVTAEVVVPDSGAEGVIIAQGGITGGWSLYAKDGKPEYCYNFLGLERTYIDGAHPIPSGTHEVRMEFSYDGGGLGKGGTVTLYVDGHKIGEGRVERTEAIAFAADERVEIGSETSAPAAPGNASPANPFSGEVSWVEIDVDEASHDLDRESRRAERAHLMARSEPRWT